MMLDLVGDKYWWSIQRLDHDGRIWEEELFPSCTTLRASHRLGEGSNNVVIGADSPHMLLMAEAIEQCVNFKTTSCAVSFDTPGKVGLMSPSHSDAWVYISLLEAGDLARQIRNKVILESMYD